MDTRRIILSASCAAGLGIAAGCATVAWSAWGWQPGMDLGPELSRWAWAATVVGGVTGGAAGWWLTWRPTLVRAGG